MISRISIANFKSIGAVDGVAASIKLDLAPLTLLIGPQGAGKSSVLEAICLFAQSIGGSGFVLQGGLVDFPSFAVIAHNTQTRKRIFISILVHDAGYAYAYTPDTGAAAQGIFKVTDGHEETLWLELRGNVREGFALRASVGAEEKAIPGNSLIPFLSAPRLDLWPEKQAELKEAALVAERLSSTIRNKVFPLFAMRGQIPYQTPASGLPLWMNTGEALLRVLGALPNPLYDQQRASVDKWANEFGLSRVGAASGASGQLQGHFVDPVLGVLLNLASASYGSRQALTMITQLFWAPSGSLIMIEEPEISLHPEAQVKLGELFAEAIKEDKQVIATTHSHFLLLALGRVVQKGLLKREDIAVYHVTKDAKGTKISPVKLNKRGYLLGWPPSYAKVEKELALEWAKALPEPPS